jgi:predicted O-linked N-acetylglucosamine transferase (SPINDLY family)
MRKQMKKELRDVDGVFAQAVTLHQQGQIPRAQEIYRQILQVAPGHFDTTYFLGVSELQLGRFEAAETLMKQALTLRPRSAEAQSTYAAILYELGRFAEALASCDKALAIKPADPDALNFRGNALSGLKRFDEAVASYDLAINLNPSFAGALANRGNALRELHRHDEALVSFERAIAVQPGFAEAFNNRGNVFRDLARLDDALANYDRAIAMRADYADAHCNRGIVLLQSRRLEEALAAFDKAIALKPDFADAWNSRGDALKEMVRLDEALESLDRAIALKPDLAEAFSIRGLVLTDLMRFDEALASFDRSIEIRPDYAVGLSNKIFCLDFVPGAGFEVQQRARKQWWDNVGARIAAGSDPRHGNDRDPERRLVVGYVSNDFRRHSAATAFRPVLEHHDKAGIQVICYSCSAVTDDATAAFQKIADLWRNAAPLSDEGLAEQIRNDKVDILVDLSGHSSGNRLGVFARKPAPVQVSAWGHAAGTGLPTVDYLFSDPVAIPQPARHLFAETIYDLPCLITMEPSPQGVHTPDPPALANGHITFGVFNRAGKLSDESIAVWARILHTVPQSRTLLKDVAFEGEQVKRRLVEAFAAHGIDAGRIVTAGRTDRTEHLRAYKDVDICLNPFPVGGGVATWESLSMGVPVVAMLGDGVSARHGGAIISSIGLTDWVTDSIEGYVATAVKFAAEPQRLAKLRKELPDLIRSSDAGNNAAYTRLVEQAYRTMWREFCAAPA